MFLRPQHFQAADRYWHEVVSTSEAWDHQYNYGLRSIQFSAEAIANQQFQLSTCQARLRDGTLVSLELGQDPDRIELDAGSAPGSGGAGSVSLKDAFAKESQTRVFLAVPKVRLGRPNVAAGSTADGVRFTAATLPMPDESRGASDQDVEMKALNVRLSCSAESLSGYEMIPIAQIKRTSDERAVPLLDEDYIPPVLAIDAWPPLGIGIVRAIYDIIGEKINVLSEQVTTRGIAFSSDVPGDLERMHMLMVLNEAYATLGCLTFALGVHPFDAFTELCRVVGKLSIFHPQRRPPQFPRYDHDNLGYIFPWLKRQIEFMLGLVRDYEYELRYFVGAGKSLQVALDPKWFNTGWNWYVGVNFSNISDKECQELLTPGQLNWKMGSSDQVEFLFRNRAPGLELKLLPQAPRAIPSTAGWLYYEVARGNAAWKDVQISQTLAMRFNEQLISNLAQLEGQRNLVVTFRMKQAVLQVALIAVPPAPSNGPPPPR
jgi:type VI secretion system protein ImpJ